jgi:hypothetical protein
MSINNYYSLYLDAVIQLAQTIVIKSTDSAEGLNRFVNDYYPEVGVSTDPSTWKYYMNLAGEYHPTDTVMTVVSMDTLETIEFTKANLLVHRATARGYAFGTRQYLELVSRYPTQEMLILGILYPVDKTTAINALDGQILGYPPELVEVNEYTFIEKLQEWLYTFKNRWINPAYGLVDPYYSAAHHALMYMHLVPAILNIRLAACKTNEAHSFHVRSYLASNSRLDAYWDQMTTNQSLFFYRNIKYIQRNAGKRETLSWLTDHIMTERSLPLAEYTMRHDISKQPTDTDPTVTFRRTPLNTKTNVDSADVVDLTTLLNKEAAAAPANSLVQVDQEPVITSEMVNSRSNVLSTKALESAMVDYTDSTPYTLSDILLNHWLWLSTTGTYTAFVGTTNPQTGERIPLSVKDAFCLMWYCWMASVGIQLDVIPPILANRVIKIPTPSKAQLMSIVDATLVEDSIADQLRNVMPTLGPILSTEAFYNFCVELTDAANIQRNIVSFQEHHMKRGMVMGMTELLYSDNQCLVADSGQNYTAWLAERNIHLGDFSTDDYGLMYQDLLKQATGLSLVSTNSLRNLQASMVKMLGQLSSYSVQFLTQINASNIKDVDWPVIRVGDVDASGSGEVELPQLNVRVKHVSAKGKDTDEFDVNKPGFAQHWAVAGHVSAVEEIVVKPHLAPLGIRTYAQVDVANITVHSAVELKENPFGVIPVLGIDAWLALAPEERRSVDIWGNDYGGPDIDTSIDLAAVIGEDDLNGLIYNQQETDLRVIILTRDLDGLVYIQH